MRDDSRGATQAFAPFGSDSGDTRSIFSSNHLRQSVWKGPVIPLEPILHNVFYRRNNGVPSFDLPNIRQPFNLFVPNYN